MTIHLQIIGVIMLVLAFVHLIFPKRFNWQIELANLSLLNRQLMEVHTFFIALVVGLNGIFLLVNAPDLVTKSALGKSLAAGMVIFWGLRLFFQLFIYKTSLWHGKKFETIIHILFILTWTYFTGIFVWLAILQFS